MIWILYALLAVVGFSAGWNIRKRGFRTYFVNLLIGIDQAANSVLGGMPDETISSRCARGRARWYWKWLAWALDKIDPNHCADALRSEKDRLHEPAVLR